MKRIETVLLHTLSEMELVKTRRVAIPKKGKHPHPDSKESWFRKAIKQRVKIARLIGHLKCDHRVNRCRYKGKSRHTANVAWATLTWNTKKITQLATARGERPRWSGFLGQETGIYKW
jgi:hypothetical protein